MSKSDGQALIERLEMWLASFITFPNEHMALAAALWAINTWVFDAFDAVPYMAVTASTKQAGKTTLLELLSFVSRTSERIGVGTMAATVIGLIESHGTQCTMFFDESEKMSRATATTMAALMNAGYRRGETVPRKDPKTGGYVKVRCFCPKLFALIGDPNDTLRDRSILFVLKRAIGARPYRPTTAANEAIALVEQIKAAVLVLKGKPIICPSYLANRDQEIWEPLVSVASGLGCDAQTMHRVEQAARWMVAGKGAEIRRYTETADSEAEWEAAVNGERALVDLAGVFKEGERFILTAEAVRRMNQSGTWGNYKGVGLDVLRLATLIAGAGVKSANVRVGKQVLKAYTRKGVFASLPSRPIER